MSFYKPELMKGQIHAIRKHVFHKIIMQYQEKNIFHKIIMQYQEKIFFIKLSCNIRTILLIEIEVDLNLMGHQWTRGQGATEAPSGGPWSKASG